MYTFEVYINYQEVISISLVLLTGSIRNPVKRINSVEIVNTDCTQVGHGKLSQSMIRGASLYVTC